MEKIPTFAALKPFEMKKFLILPAIALMMMACGQQNNDKAQTEEQKYIVPPGMPVAPMQQEMPLSSAGFDDGQQNPQSPVLHLDEGKPLDFSQLMGPRKSIEEQVASKIDSIRFYAEQGKPDFQYLYGRSFENGWGVEADAKQAYEWYKKAADQKQPAAYTSLGNLYRMGNGVKQDPKQALYWYQLGADAGDDDAMLNVGNCFYYGMGTDKDLAKAITMWQTAADNGNAYAMAQMGDCYYAGFGVEKDLEKALHYLTQAVDKNVSSAQYRLGLMYFNGEGVAQDRTYCKLLMQKARDGGMTEAQAFLEKNF